VNVKDYGARGDGTTNDVAAIERAIQAAPDGAVILFPPGTYLISKAKGIEVKKRRGLAFLGRGATIQRDSRLPGNTRLMTITDCEDITMRDLAFDVNHIEKFGGINVYTSRRFRVEGCRAFDSNLRDTWKDYDHYSWVFQTCSDVWMRDCYAQDVELIEIDYCRRVWIVNNTIIRPAGTTAIGWFSVHSRAPGFDYHIEGNTIIDAPKMSIAVSMESRGQDNNVVRRFVIARNRIVHEKVPGGYGILVGNVSGPNPKGNVFANITIEGNQFETAAGLKRTSAEIYLQASWRNPPEQHPFFTGVRIVGNTIYGGAGADRPAIGVIHATRSTIARNKVFGVKAGIHVQHASACQVLDNQVEATGVAYRFGPSYGGNVWRGNQCVGVAPATPFDKQGVKPTDALGSVSVVPAAPAQREKKQPVAERPKPPGRARTLVVEPFDSLEGFTLRKRYKCVEAKAELEGERFREGRASVRVTWSAAPDSYGVVDLVKSIPLTDIRGATFEFSLMPLTANSGYWGIELYDDQGRRVEAHRVYSLPPKRWHTVRFTQGRKLRYGWIRKGDGDPRRVSRVVLRAQTHRGNQEAQDLWDGFRIVAPEGEPP